MATLLLIIFIVITIILVKIDDWDYEIFMATALVGALLSGIVVIVLSCCYPYNVDKKIDMYTEENAEIEQKVKATVQAYTDYEQETYKNLIESADLQTLLIKYPELNSNELVKKEIEIYVSNNDKIKSLKEQKIDKKIIGWWLFFNIGVENAE